MKSAHYIVLIALVVKLVYGQILYNWDGNGAMYNWEDYRRAINWQLVLPRPTVTDSDDLSSKTMSIDDPLRKPESTGADYGRQLDPLRKPESTGADYGRQSGKKKKRKRAKKRKGKKRKRSSRKKRKRSSRKKRKRSSKSSKESSESSKKSSESSQQSTKACRESYKKEWQKLCLEKLKNGIDETFEDKELKFN